MPSKSVQGVLVSLGSLRDRRHAFDGHSSNPQLAEPRLEGLVDLPRPDVTSVASTREQFPQSSINKQPPSPRVELSIKPEVTALDVNDTADIWVAVDARAPAQSPAEFVVEGAAPDIVDTNNTMAALGYTAIAGDVFDVSFGVRMEDGCVLKEVLGQERQASFTQGGTVSIFLRVRVPPLPRPTSRHGDNKHDKGADLQTALKDVDHVLGETRTAVCTVFATYHGSSQPHAEAIVVEQTLSIRRPNSESIWSVPAVPPWDVDPAVVKAELRRCLESQVREMCSPQEALQALSRIFGDKGRACVFCSDHLCSTHHGFPQEAAISDHTFVASGLGPNLRPSSSPHLGQFPREIENTLKNDESASTTAGVLSQTDVTRETSRLLMTDSCRNSTGPSTGFETSHPRAHAAEPIDHPQESTGPSPNRNAPTSAPHDRARQIWRHMRRDSRGHQKLTGRSSLEKVIGGDEQARHIRDVAIRNQRSVGADTLRSLSGGTLAALRDHGGGCGAPWL